MIDIRSFVLDEQEITMIKNPLCGGVILFSRNFSDKKQLNDLCQSIRAIKKPSPLICVDHEGGRVQRFHQGFISLPPMAELGKIYQENKQDAIEYSYNIGECIAMELQSCGIDFSFTPVLDINHGNSGVIGDRAFSHNPLTITTIAHSLMKGMQDNGMQAVGKHFPGHGYVKADSHLSLPIDDRDFDSIYTADLRPFKAMIQHNIAAIMPAHIIYQKIDPDPAGFSKFWLQDILRNKLEFEGVIFSDDLSMAGAKFAGSYIQRAKKALDAGCDMVLVCNHPAEANNILDNLDVDKIKNYNQAISSMRLLRMHGKNITSYDKLKYNNRYQNISQKIKNKFENHDLQMDL